MKTLQVIGLLCVRAVMVKTIEFIDEKVILKIR